MSELEQTTQNQPTPTVRRRRKPKRPKWVKNKFTYQLWRNWPLIRFALLVLAAVLGVLGGSSFIALYGCASAILGSRGVLKQRYDSRNTQNKDNSSDKE